MNKYFKGTVIFVGGVIGGFGLCSGLVLKKIVTSEDLLRFFGEKIAKKIVDCMYEDDERYIFETRSNAEKVVADMEEIIEKYGCVTVADFYDLVGVISNYTDSKKGWTNLEKTRIIRVRAGYELQLPIAITLS